MQWPYFYNGRITWSGLVIAFRDFGSQPAQYANITAPHIEQSDTATKLNGSASQTDLGGKDEIQAILKI